MWRQLTERTAFTHRQRADFSFLCPQRPNYWRDPKNHWWCEMMKQTSSTLPSRKKFGGNRTTHFCVTVWGDCVFCFSVTFAQFDGFGNVLITSTWRSVFVSRPILTMLAAFLGEDKSVISVGSYQWANKFSKSSLGGATMNASMPEKIFKIWENGCKEFAHHFGHLEARWKKRSTTAFYHMYCGCASVSKYFATSLQGAMEGSEWHQYYCAHRNAINPCNFKQKCFGGFL